VPAVFCLEDDIQRPRLILKSERGHEKPGAVGASSKPAGPYSSRMLADDAKALVDRLGITDFHLMGISMGG
jgi:pimeloyl-ACP methyl ester carboxylesterase